MAGELTFFEIGVEDAQRGRAFYEALFGWTFEPGPSGGGGFGITAPNVAGGMHGGDKGAAPYVFFAVDDIDAAADRVRELGGEIEEHGHGRRGGVGRQVRALQAVQGRPGARFGLHRPPD